VVERPYGTVSMPGGEAAWGLDLSWRRFGPGRTLGGAGVRTESQRPGGFLLAAMVTGGFLVVCGLLAYLFLLNGIPDGWFSGVDVGRLQVGERNVAGWG
jgi:Derlin-2/3